jgi:disulfide bond formation protein DsbB
MLFAALLAFALALTASGFILEYGFGVIPCKMCWWQRYVHWAIAGFALIGLAIHNKQARLAMAFAVAAASIAGLYIALWQFAAQHHWLPFPPSCSGGGISMADPTNLLAAMDSTKIVPCDKENFKLLGLSLAGWNIPAMAFTLALSVLAARKSR